MKTFILQTVEGSPTPARVEIKVDAFCKNTDFLEPGFDTRFTNMEIVNDDEAVKAGVNLQLIEDRYQNLLQLAKDVKMGLVVVDINHPASTITLYEPEVVRTVTIIPPEGDIVRPSEGEATYQFEVEIDPEDSGAVIEWEVTKAGLTVEGLSIDNTGLLTVESTASNNGLIKVQVDVTTSDNQQLSSEITFYILLP